MWSFLKKIRTFSCKSCIMEEETENPQKYVKILSTATFLCISQALLPFSSRLPTKYPNLRCEIPADLKQPVRYLFRSFYNSVTNSCHIWQESMTMQLPVEGVGRYSVRSQRRWRTAQRWTRVT